VVAILRVAAIDAEPSRRLSARPEIVSLLDRLRADLRALGALLDADRARIGAAKDGPAEIVGRRRKQVHHNEQAYEELTRALERDHADALRCMRLVYDPGWVERDFVPPTLRPLPKADP